VKYLAVLVLAVFVPLGSRGSDSGWTLVRSSHFHVYSQLGEHDGRSIALTLEQIRAFFRTSGTLGAHAALENERPVRVLQFATTSAYASFRPRASADAFFLGSEAANYIVLAPAVPNRARTLAHEYAHLVVHLAGIHLPSWFVVVSPTPFLVTIVLVLNGIGGILLGKVYWHWGIEAAILCHFAGDIMVQGIGPILIGAR